MADGRVLTFDFPSLNLDSVAEANRHQAIVRAVAFSPNGQWLASAPGPGTGRDFEDAARSGEHLPCRRLCRRRLGRRRCLRRRKCCLHYGGQLLRRFWRRRWRGRRLQGASVSHLGRGPVLRQKKEGGLSAKSRPPETPWVLERS